MDITYGLDVKSEYDPFAEAAGNAITALNGALTNNFLVESFPSRMSSLTHLQNCHLLICESK